MTITDDILREAMALALAGGTKEHPYNQRLLGEPECGTPCCVMGLAFALAGDEDGWRRGWPPIPEDATHWRCTVQNVLQGSGEDCLRAALLVDKRGSLAGADLSGMQLRHANFSGTDLRGANLNEAGLCHADLLGANLCDANFKNAKMRWAHLSEADLSGADLSGADLHGANFYKADLHRAIMIGADLTGTYGLPMQRD